MASNSNIPSTSGLTEWPYFLDVERQRDTHKSTLDKLNEGFVDTITAALKEKQKSIQKRRDDLKKQVEVIDQQLRTLENIDVATLTSDQTHKLRAAEKSTHTKTGKRAKTTWELDAFLASLGSDEPTTRAANSDAQ